MRLNEAHFADPDAVGSSEYRALHDLLQDVLDSVADEGVSIEEANLAVAGALEELRRHIDDLMPHVKELVEADADDEVDEQMEYKLISLDEPETEIRRKWMRPEVAEADNADMAAIAARSGYGLRRWVLV